MLPRTFILALVGLGVSSSGAMAQTCSEPRCGVSLQRIPLEVPANTPGFALNWSTAPEGARFFDMKRIDDGSGTAIPVEVVGDALKLGKELVSGAQYQLTETAICDGEESSFDHYFSVADALELPMTLGYIEPLGPMEMFVGLPDAEGVCEDREAYGAVLQLYLEGEAAVWAHQLIWETVVDGEVWSPPFSNPPVVREAWVTRHVHAACPDYSRFVAADGIAEGIHEMRLCARLPGSDFSIETPDVTVDLTCPLPECPGGAAFDVESGMCEEPLPDYDGYDDCTCYSSEDRRRCSCPVDYVDEDTGGCSASGSPASSGAALLAVLGALVARRRRRRV